MEHGEIGTGEITATAVTPGAGRKNGKQPSNPRKRGSRRTAGGNGVPKKRMNGKQLLNATSSSVHPPTPPITPVPPPPLATAQNGSAGGSAPAAPDTSGGSAPTAVGPSGASAPATPEPFVAHIEETPQPDGPAEPEWRPTIIFFNERYFVRLDNDQVIF